MVRVKHARKIWANLILTFCEFCCSGFGHLEQCCTVTKAWTEESVAFYINSNYNLHYEMQI